MKRDTTIDILKGLGIILVVIGHSGCPEQMRDIIYSFHMPLFFIASGWFFKSSSLENKKDFFLRKVKGVYLPFLKWSLIFLLLHNVFFYFGIQNSMYGNIDGATPHWYSLKEMGRNVINIVLRMRDYDPFVLGAYWFLRSLFVGSIVFLFSSWAVSRLVKSKDMCIAIVMVLSCLAGGVMTYTGIHIPLVPQGGFREVMTVFFLGCGYFIKQYEDKSVCSGIADRSFPPTAKSENFQRGSQNNPCQSGIRGNFIVATAILLFVVCVTIHPTSMSYKAIFKNWVVLPFTGVSGFVLLYKLSSYISRKRKMGDILAYVGQNSFYILTFHFLMFKPVSLLKASYYGLDWHYISSHPVIHQVKDSWFWIIYTLVSILLSLLLMEIIKRLSKKYAVISYLHL